MKLFLFVVCSLCCSCISGQFCPSPPDFAMIEDNFASRVGGEVGGTFNLTEIYYNCIAYGGTGGNEFRELTITGRYQVGSAAPALGQASYECRNPGTPTWDNLRVILGIGLAVNETTRGCADCQGMTSNNCTRKRNAVSEGRDSCGFLVLQDAMHGSTAVKHLVLHA